MWIFEQAIAETFILNGSLISGHTQDQSKGRFEHGHRRRFTTGQDKITERNFLQTAGIDHTLVEPFKPAAEKG